MFCLASLGTLLCKHPLLPEILNPPSGMVWWGNHMTTSKKCFALLRLAFYSISTPSHLKSWIRPFGWVDEVNIMATSITIHYYSTLFMFTNRWVSIVSCTFAGVKTEANRPCEIAKNIRLTVLACLLNGFTSIACWKKCLSHLRKSDIHLEK